MLFISQKILIWKLKVGFVLQFIFSIFFPYVTFCRSLSHLLYGCDIFVDSIWGQPWYFSFWKRVLGHWSVLSQVSLLFGIWDVAESGHEKKSKSKKNGQEICLQWGMLRVFCSRPGSDSYDICGLEALLIPWTMWMINTFYKLCHTHLNFYHFLKVRPLT